VSWKAAIGWGLGAAAIAGCVLLYRACDAARTGDPASATLVDGKDGPELLVMNVLEDDDSADQSQVTAIDARTGATLGSRRFDQSSGSCWDAVPGRLWCDFGRLALHDARTLETVLAFDDAVAHAQLGRPMSDQWATDGAHAWLQLDDGRVARLDAATLAVAIDDAPPDHANMTTSAQASNNVETTSEIDLRGKHWQIDGTTRAPIVKGGPLFLTPHFVLAGNEPLLVDGDPVILYSTSLDQSRDRPQLARISDSGAAVWSVELGGEVQLVAHVADSIVVATGATDHRALAIDARTGAVRWSYSQ
jgi:hypothetical protein